MARAVKIAEFTIVDGDKVVERFDGYDELYTWATNMKEKYPTVLGTIMGDPRIIMLFGEVPLKYDLKTGKLYELSWHEVEIGGTKCTSDKPGKNAKRLTEKS